MAFASAPGGLRPSSLRTMRFRVRGLGFMAMPWEEQELGGNELFATRKLIPTLKAKPLNPLNPKPLNPLNPKPLNPLNPKP